MKQKAVKVGRRLLALGLAMSTLGNLCITADAEETGPYEESSQETVVFATMDVDVSGIGINSDTFNVGQDHTWILRCGIPEQMGSLSEYLITDVIDENLTLRRGSLTAALHNSGGEVLPLKEGVHYSRWEGNLQEQISVSLTPEGRQYVEANLGTGQASAEIRLEFEAAINCSAALGETISNRASLLYVDAAGVRYHVESDVAEVHTGGICLKKTDIAGNPLSEAVFKAARPATEEELADPAAAKEIIVLEEEILTVVYLDFYNNKAMTGEKVNQVTTNEAGMAEICGLAYGTYYIVEARAPYGYNLLTQPIGVIIDESSHITGEEGWLDVGGNVVDNTVTIVNTKYMLPNSGGMGTTLFTVTGTWIILCSLILLIMNRKRI